MPFDLNGAWTCNDGGTYFVRQEGDLVTWAGLEASGFHMGMGFTNVFQGRIAPDGTTLTGEWVDVPRGTTNNSGILGLHISEVELPAPPPPHLPPGEPSPPDPPRMMLEMQQIPELTTGGFGGSFWASNGASLAPQDIRDLAGRVRRYDVALGENNPPHRDFTVMWGTVGRIGVPNLPPSPLDYCSFVGDWDGDGDFVFHLADIEWSLMDSDFWTSGWIDSNTDILGHFDRSDKDGYTWIFHCEAPMYGRENDSDNCTDAPQNLLPGWQEAGGNSVLINGEPIEGRVSAATDHTVPPPDNAALVFGLERAKQTLMLRRDRSRVRVTGVVASDPDHWDDDGQPPEIHPVYAIDILQDFAEPRQLDTNLTGVWQSDDMGTYYARQIGGALWWLGMSCDQGRTFANVFRGSVAGDTIEGTWVDVPMGVEGVLGGGSLFLHGSGLAAELLKTAESAGYGGTVWTKLYDTLATLPNWVTHPVVPVGPVLGA